MDVVLITFILLFFVFLWRGLTAGSNVVARGFQKCLHCCGPAAAFFQWYTLLFIGLGALVARTFWDVVRFEYIKYAFLQSPELAEDEGFIPGLTAADKWGMKITPVLRIFSLAAPIAGALAGVLVMEHVYKLVRENARRNKEQGAPFPWALSRELNMVVLVIAMPIVFILMAMRAEIRVWAVMTGSAWLPYHEGPQPPAADWATAKALELTAYRAGLETASMFQYFTIFSFGQLCVGYLRNAPEQYRFAFKWAGLQGVYLYVIMGALRSAATIAEVILSQSKNEKYKILGAIIQDKVLTFTAPIATAAALMCVYNMLIVGKMDDIKKVLGSVTMKFQATRLLVLISQIQQGVLLGLVVGASVYEQTQKPTVPKAIREHVAGWDLSTDRAMLIHAALLNIECLIVVLMNRCTWSIKADYSSVEIKGAEAEVRTDNGLQKPLLGAEAVA